MTVEIQQRWDSEIFKKFKPIGLRIDKWARGNETIDFSRPNTYLAYGTRGSGKSALLEVLGMFYILFGPLLDLYGARDNEGLGWLRCKGLDKFLLITDSNIDLKCSYNTVKVDDFNLHDAEKYQAIISVPSFYSTEEHEFKGLAKIVNKLYNRGGWTIPWYCLIRESKKFIYSRMSMGENSALAKATFVKFLSEARHSGIAVGADALRPRSIDVDVREIADYIFIKALGNISVPDELRYVYSLIQPMYIANMKPERFIMLSKNRPVGLGSFDYPPFHKEEKENLLPLLDIQVDKGEAPELKLPVKRDIKWETHKHIVKLREDGLSYDSIGIVTKKGGNYIPHSVANRQMRQHEAGVCECFNKKQ